MTDIRMARWRSAVHGGQPGPLTRLRAGLLLCAIGALVQRPGLGQRVALTASPNPAAPGQTVTIVWHFVGDKIILQGGRFGWGRT